MILFGLESGSGNKGRDPATKFRIRNTDLKGQCHEMVVEVRPWSGSLALN
jgi:hypothetical protein